MRGPGCGSWDVRKILSIVCIIILRVYLYHARGKRTHHTHGHDDHANLLCCSVLTTLQTVRPRHRVPAPGRASFVQAAQKRTRVSPPPLSLSLYTAPQLAPNRPCRGPAPSTVAPLATALKQPLSELLSSGVSFGEHRLPLLMHPKARARLTRRLTGILSQGTGSLKVAPASRLSGSIPDSLGGVPASRQHSRSNTARPRPFRRHGSRPSRGTPPPAGCRRARRAASSTARAPGP